MIYPRNIEDKIGFSDIRALLQEACHSDMGREMVDAIAYTSDYHAIQQSLQITQQLLQVLAQPELGFPRGEIIDIRESLHRIRIEGLYLDEEELQNIGKTLGYASELIQFLENLEDTKYNLLRALVTQREYAGIGKVIREIDGILDRYGRLSDNASPELHRIRQDIARQQGTVG